MIRENDNGRAAHSASRATPERRRPVHPRLATRVSLSAGTAVLVVMAVFGVLLHQRGQAEIRAWERENLAALGHHAAQMISASSPVDRPETVARLTEELRGFGVELHVTGPPGGGGEGPFEENRSADVPAVRVPLDESGTEVAVMRHASATSTLGERLFTLYAVLLGLVTVSLVGVIHASVHWSLVRPLRRVHAQLRQMVRGPWASDASEDGTHEVASLAREVEAVGTNLSERVPQWIEAERKAASELARRRLRERAVPELRILNLLVGDLLAKGDLSRDAVRELRGAQAASDRLAVLLDVPIHYERPELRRAAADRGSHGADVAPFSGADGGRHSRSARGSRHRNHGAGRRSPSEATVRVPPGHRQPLRETVNGDKRPEPPMFGNRRTDERRHDMTPIELLAHSWIWYALFGVIAVLSFLRTRRRRTASIAAMSSGWPDRRMDHDDQGRGHGCC